MVHAAFVIRLSGGGGEGGTLNVRVSWNGDLEKNGVIYIAMTHLARGLWVCCGGV